MTDNDAPVIPRVLNWVGDVRSRIASRLGALPVRVKAVIAGVAAITLVAAIAVPTLVFANSPAPTGAPSATASVPPTRDPEQDDAPAGGPCQTLLDPTTLAAALGSSTNVSVTRGKLAVAIVGGFDCRYTFGDEDSPANKFTPADDVGYVDLTVAPADITSADALRVSLKPVQCFESTAGTWIYECESIVAVGDWWYGLSIGNRASRDELQASFTAITNGLEDALAVAPAPQPAVVVQPFDCASAAIEMPLLETTREHYAGIYGNNELRMAASLLAAPVTCSFGWLDGDEWHFEVYPGGASAYESCTSGPGLSISVPGTTAAFARTIPGYPELCATDGTSAVLVKRRAADDTGYVEFVRNDPALDVLASLLEPVFDAIVPSTSPYVAQPAAASASASVTPLLGGNCSSLFDPATLAVFTDESLEADMRKYESGLELVGGIQCSYLFGKDVENFGYTPYFSVHVHVAPSAIADPAVLGASLSDVDCRSWIEANGTVHSRCDAITAVHGWWYGLQVFSLQPEDELRSDFATITSMLESSLAAAAPPARVKAVQPFDCGAVADDMSWSSRRATSAGSSAISVAASLLAAPAMCEYILLDQHWTLTVDSGSAAFDACTSRRYPGQPLPAPVSIPGVELLLPLEGGGYPMGCATDGLTTVTVSGWGGALDADTEPWDEATRATLSELLLPIFAAAG